jgi:hypothetical protein
MWKNRGRDAKVGRREVANVDRKQRRLEAMGDRRPGVQEAAEGSKTKTRTCENDVVHGFYFVIRGRRRHRRR